ncbi:uncharacterized protein E0L32_009181 [Thyridium curvatum]|uniref:Integral membrane protein n=1 Tax=Thyridium curvatum TaxID=1093900 RepID=A0A507AZC1_9PEZI|nr:uncharacterized protein E0L32_009181 [Thyridium curvatum]TPX09580.1 hypothetical protein E0L32_009181 [Thyridium curvatum]
MRSTTRSALLLLAGAAALELVPTVLAHGMDMDMGGEMDMSQEEPKPDPESYAPNYFAHPEHKAAIYAHIALMIIGWVFMLPVSVMFSLARSRYTLLSQFVFLATNAVGLLIGMIYNGNTPDLYPNNAHHKLGWVVTWTVCAQALVSLLGRVSGAFNASADKAKHADERHQFIPVSTNAMEEHDNHHPSPYRFSNDSGQGTEPRTESLRSGSLSSHSQESIPLRDVNKEFEEDDLEAADLPAPLRSGRAHSVAAKIAAKISSRVWKPLILAYNIVDRVILPLAFITICTGIITFGRLFEGGAIFSGLAHWIKGGVFFWLGLFTLGRWAGAFGELGWAWNVRPRTARQKWRPSAEFVESFLIFFYGSTNIFLEHLANAGGEWSPQDLEHISITVLFIGGGLMGMLVESTRIRSLLNTTVAEAVIDSPEHVYRDEELHLLEQPETYKFSINPIPALVILLTGIMMSSHTQPSMISTMVHRQWGNLLSAASFARGFTYLVMFLKPPKSVLPSRPPTELLAAFGLISGGVIFMASASDTVEGMIHYDMDAMFIYTVTMGLVGLLMAWEVLCIALKGWAVRKEAGRPAGSYRIA